MSEGSTQFRLTVVGVLLLMLFSALFARLWFLQVAQSGDLAHAATTNRIRVVHEEAIRGRILDVKGRPLVENRVVDQITFDRSVKVEDEDRDAMVARLAELLGKSSEDVDKILDDPKIAQFAVVPVAVDVPEDVVTYIREHQEEFPGVAAARAAVREYPQGKLAAHVLGYIGEINQDELESHEGEGYQEGDSIGKAGVEQMFEAELRGQPRTLRLEVDSRGRVVNVLDDEPAVPGHDIRLTIDMDIQRVAEESLAQGMEGARQIADVDEDSDFDFFQATGGTVVVLDPNDGSVVAMASAPDYDPAQLSEGLSTSELEQFQEPESSFPLLNRAIQGQYAPGSTFKLVTSLAGLDSGVLKPDTRFNDEGCITISELEYCNAGDKEHGTVDVSSALTVSSDVFFYEVGRDMWQYYTNDDLDRGYAIQEQAEELGFGHATGLGLSGEAAGRIPDKQFKEDFNATNPDLEQRRVNSLWLPGDSANLAVGQGDLLVTPMQLVNAYATFANGGTRYTPRLANAILEAGTGNESAGPAVLRELGPQPIEEIDIDPAARDQILLGMIGVTTNSEGTARDAFEGYGGFAAGKTGTAEVKPKQDTSLFVGFNPADNPRYVTLAIVEQGGFGAAVAAPIVRRVMEALDGNLDPAPVVVRPPSEDSD